MNQEKFTLIEGKNEIGLLIAPANNCCIMLSRNFKFQMLLSSNVELSDCTQRMSI